MSLKYNFAFKNSDLKKWDPEKNRKAKDLITNRQKFELVVSYIKKNPFVFLPQLLVISLFAIIQIVCLYPKFVIKRLTPIHNEYIFTTQKINKINRDFNKLKKFMRDLEPNFKFKTPTYLFTFYIQNSIPINVQLRSYKLNNSSFYLQASSYGLKPINEMISLLIEAPIIDNKSIFINKIKRDNSSDELITVEITGKILKTNLKNKEFLYKESSAFGLLEKLSRFKNIKEVLK